MKNRFAQLLLVLTGFMFLGGVIYFGVIQPLDSRAQTTMLLESEVADRTAKRDSLLRQRHDLVAALPRSLPADVDTARQEYDATIVKLLRESGVSSEAYSVRPKATDGKYIPDLGNKKPAYTRIALEIRIKPIDMPTLTELLRRYYALGILHQITRFSVKKSEGTKESRADLEAILVTEAIVLDGAEKRKSLLPIPEAFGALGGGAGKTMLAQTPEVARQLKPVALAHLLAVPDRNYARLHYFDPFHGIPPPPPPPPPTKPEISPEPPQITEAPPPPKEDTGAFIRLTGFGRRPDGTGNVIIEDRAGRIEYEITLGRERGLPVSHVVKSFFTTKGAKKKFEPTSQLDISEATSGTARLFRIVGLQEDGLIVAERELNPDDRKTRARRTAEGAIAGPGAAAIRREKWFFWPAGATLAELKELKPSEVERLPTHRVP